MLCGSFRFQAGREALLLPQLPAVLVLETSDEGDASLLEEGALGLKEVADHVGYGSEASFSKAFKSFAGVPPGRWRERHADE